MLIELLIALLIVGAVLYIISILPIDSRIKTIIYVIAVVAIAIWAIRTLLPAAGVS